MTNKLVSSMENDHHCHLQKENSAGAGIVAENAMSGEALSLSSVPTSVQQQEVVDQEPEFEFGCCVTPESPTSDSNKDSPADLLFFNGKLLPHSFPFHHKSFKDATHYTSSTNSSTPIRRTNSISSKDSYSFTSSRSNSSNSRSSCSSLASPTSTFSSSPSPTSDVAAKQSKAIGTKNFVKKPTRAVQPCNVTIPRPRWYFIRPAPLLISSVEIGRRKKVESKANKQVIIKKRSRVRSWFGWRYFRSIVWACKACHALDESSTK